MGNEKDSKKRILASLVMGLNCVNSFAPMAVAVNVQPENVPAKPVKETVAEPEQYTAACYQALDVVDSAIFGTAEAAFTETVNAGTTVTGETIEVSALGTTGNYSVQTVNGGSTISCTIQSGGTQNVSAGFANAFISSGGVQNVSEGSVYVSIFSGGVQNVSGGNARAFISSGGVQNVSGGYLDECGISSGGVQNVSGGVVGLVWVRNGGVQNVSEGGSAAWCLLVGGTQNVSGGLVTSVDISSGGVQNVSGGIATYNRIYNGVQNVSGGTATSNIIYSAGVQNVSGGIATDNSVCSGGVQNVRGGTASNTTVDTGAVQNVYGGTAIHNQAGYEYNAGGTINIYGGTATDNGALGLGVINVIDGLVQRTMLGFDDTYDRGVLNVSGGIVEDTEIRKLGVQNISGGTVSVTNILSGGTQVVDGGIVKDTTVEAGGIEILHAGDVKGTVLNGGITEVHSDAIDFGDLTMNDGITRFGADGGNYNITGNFAFNGGVVDLVSNPDGHNPNPRTYESLTIANLTGNDGIFKLDTDLDKAVAGSETTNGDKIIINTGTAGTHYIQVADESLYTGTEITGDRKLLLVTDNSGVQNLVMEGKDLNNGGVWITHAPTIFKEGNNWYIGYVQKEASNDTTVYLTDRQVAVYNQWTRISNDSLRKRLGDLRYNDAEAGVWARFYSGKLSGTGYDQSYHTYQVGFDKTNGNNTFGIALERQESNQSYTYGNGEGTTNAGNIYFTNYSDKGTFFDAILKYGKMNSKYSTLGTFPDGADYDTPAYSLSLEYGKTNNYKNGYFVEPKIQFTYGQVGAETYTTNRGTIVEEEAIKSLIGNVGFVAGRKVGDSDYYFKAGIFREFKGERDVHLAATNGENMYKSEDYGDTWFELGLGGNVKLGKNTHVYGDVEKSFGADIQKKWQVNAGVRWEF